MSCCGTRNLLLAFRSQDFDRCHSFLLALPAPGGARKRPLLRYPQNAAGLRFSLRFSTAATPFCSLLPPPAALANVPASGSLHMRLIFETSLSFISYPGAACQSKPEALCALKLAQDEIGLAGIESQLDALYFSVCAVAAADPVAQRSAAVVAVDYADAIRALCPAQRRVDGDAGLGNRHAVHVKLDDRIVHSAPLSSRSSARLRARPPA